MSKVKSLLNYAINDKQGLIIRFDIGDNVITEDQYKRLQGVDVFIEGVDTGLFVVSSDEAKKPVADGLFNDEPVVEKIEPDFSIKHADKLALDKYALEFGIELNRSKSMKNMLIDFKALWLEKEND